MSSFQELLALRQKKLSMALADTPEGGAGFIIIIITIITITITFLQYSSNFVIIHHSNNHRTTRSL